MVTPVPVLKRAWPLSPIMITQLPSRSSKPLAEKGNVRAQNTLGKMFNYGGTGLLLNDREAVKWFRKAAKQGDAECQLNLWAHVFGGDGGVKGHRGGDTVVSQGAQGNALAQYRIGEIYSTGMGVKRNDKEAERWYRRAAERGNPPEAMQMLGETV